MEEVKETIRKLEVKLELIQKISEEISAEALNESKVLELEDKSGERKYAKSKADQCADEFLSEKMSYVLGKVTKNENGDEEFVKIKIDGACVRTLEEDANYDPEAEAEAAAPTKKKR